MRQTYCSWKEAALAHFEKLPDSPITMKFHDNDDDNGGNNHNVMVLHLYLNLLRPGLYLCLYCETGTVSVFVDTGTVFVFVEQGNVFVFVETGNVIVFVVTGAGQTDQIWK